MKTLTLTILLSLFFTGCFHSDSDSPTGGANARTSIVINARYYGDNLGGADFLFNTIPAPYPEVIVNGKVLDSYHYASFGNFFVAESLPVGTEVPFTIRSGDDVLSGALIVPRPVSLITVNSIPVLLEDVNLLSPLTRNFIVGWDAPDHVTEYFGRFRYDEIVPDIWGMDSAIGRSLEFNRHEVTTYEVDLSHLAKIDDILFFVAGFGHGPLKTGDLPAFSSLTMSAFLITEAGATGFTMRLDPLKGEKVTLKPLPPPSPQERMEELQKRASELLN